MTTKAKSTEHAKGPWQAIKFPNLPWAVYETGPHELIVCQVSNPDWNRDEANARLIAAAPELLAALRALLDCPDIADNDHKDEETHAAERMARAAITKAGGTHE